MGSQSDAKWFQPTNHGYFSLTFTKALFFLKLNWKSISPFQPSKSKTDVVILDNILIKYYMNILLAINTMQLLFYRCIFR